MIVVTSGRKGRSLMNIIIYSLDSLRLRSALKSCNMFSIRTNHGRDTSHSTCYNLVATLVSVGEAEPPRATIFWFLISIIYEITFKAEISLDINYHLRVIWFFFKIININDQDQFDFVPNVTSHTESFLGYSSISCTDNHIRSL